MRLQQITAFVSGLLVVTIGMCAELRTIANTDLQRLLSTPIEGTTSFSLVGVDAHTKSITTTWKRIQIYAPSARIYAVDGKKYREVARDTRLHFISTGSERMGLSIDAKTRDAQGVMVRDGKIYTLSGTAGKSNLQIDMFDAEEKDASGHIQNPSCAGSTRSLSPSQALLLPNSSVSNTISKTAKTAMRQAVIAVDTDNELMSLKFSNNETSATTYIADLFVALNVLYEDDPTDHGLQLRLVQGDTFLRPSSTEDPYPSTTSMPIYDQLTEFGEYWRVNQTTISRAFSMLLSGKLATGQAGGGSGMAWVLGAGSYCGSTGFVFGTPSRTFGHYSVNRISTIPSSSAASMVGLVGHEIGHNLGADHTHCSDATTGGRASMGTIDQCYNGEASTGCYAGATSCPTSGPGAPAGTLMSYCHINPSCSRTNEMHPTHVAQLDARINSQSASCITSLSIANQAPTISTPTSYSGTEDTALTLTSITFSDADALSNPVQATFSVTGGASVVADSAAGVTIGVSPSARTLIGSLLDINNLIGTNRLRYVPANQANGLFSLNVTINDQGHSGTGGALSASQTIDLNIAAVNDPPNLTTPTTLNLSLGQSVNLNGIVINDVDAESGNIRLTLSAVAGTLTLALLPA